MVEDGMDEDRESLKELVRLVELDYQRTADFINSVVGTGTTVRGWAVTIWVAIVGVAVDRSAWELALVGAVVAAVFFILDGYHAWVYSAALTHAASLERVSSAYFNSLGRDRSDPDSMLHLQMELQSHRFGLYRNVGKFRWRELLHVRPKVVFFVFYPLLLIVAGLISLLIATGGNMS